MDRLAEMRAIYAEAMDEVNNGGSRYHCSTQRANQCRLDRIERSWPAVDFKAVRRMLSPDDYYELIHRISYPSQMYEEIHPHQVVNLNLLIAGLPLKPGWSMASLN